MTSLATPTSNIRHAFNRLPSPAINLRASIRVKPYTPLSQSHSREEVLTKVTYSTVAARPSVRTADLRQACSHPGDRGHICSRHTQSGSMAAIIQPRYINRVSRETYATEATPSTSTAIVQPSIHPVFQDQTGTWQYVVADPRTKKAVIIDAVLDYDPSTQTASTSSADALLALVRDQGYEIDMILETHVHADHPTAAAYLRAKLSQEPGSSPSIGIGKRINHVQELFAQRYGVPATEYEGVFDKLFDDDETFDIGSMSAQAIHLPGHTPDHLGYKIGDNVFCGDSLFHADVGTARCDFPGGSAHDLFKSTRKLLSMADEVKIWTGHDYPPEGRAIPQPYMTVREHRALNKHLKDDISEDDFVTLRRERDAQLGEPRLLHQSLQVNIRAGRLPGPTPFGQRLLHLPLKLKVKEW
ncbi:hypothetical protein PV08_00277 [Exophiala spinifera]|uniref:Metallo-beta-lactamase domain-containing protein n=1 Tax=Exophiala spinifera TaxID=91928 RepID=A0A0D2BL67_9EURO|nr:uncharacterized protein PV08_00277 [Exophiala spinifera]KIW19703.1 hypothetical protein PV08_00277 [Exophiala spinifera]